MTLKISSIRVPVAVFFLSFFFYHWVGWVLAAPFTTPDSGLYFEMSRDPWNHFGKHFPSAFPWALYLGRLLHLSPHSVLALLSATKATLLYLVLSSAYLGPAIWFALGFLLLSPELLVLDFSAWTESGFLTVAVAIAFVLVRARSIRWAGPICSLLFLLLVEFRHAGIFLLPGLAVALGAVQARAGATSFRPLRQLLMSGVWGVVLMVLWMCTNLARTGSPTSPSVGHFECLQYLAAFNTLPYCSYPEPPEVCKLDPGHAYINNPEKDLNSFPDRGNPVRQIWEKSPDSVCELWAGVRRAVIKQHPLNTVYLVATRFVLQFGRWNSSERGAASFVVPFPYLALWFDSMLDFNQWSWALQVLGLIAVLYGRGVRGTLSSPVLCFLVIGGIGHAFGLALNNPFTVLRYMGVHRCLLTCAGVLCLPDCVRRIRQRCCGSKDEAVLPN